MDAIRLQNVDFRRGERAILSEITWTVRAGEHWALLGANGSGKTTLLKIINGYEWPTEGAVQVLGEDFGQCSIPALRKRIGYASSALAGQLTGWLSGRDTALSIVVSGIEASIGLYRDFTEAELEQGRRALAKVGAANIADQRYSLLSQGEQQRTLIARALVTDPGLLVLDEPCAGLDPAARDTFLADLGRMAKRPDSPTLILVTHHIEEIGPWIDRVLVLKAGRVLARGTRGEVLKSSTLADGFGFRCDVSRQGGHYYLRSDRQ